MGRFAPAVNLSEIGVDAQRRIRTGIAEFDEVIGGGIVPGSLVLLGGDPGIGKSTLALQISMLLKQGVLYVSGEESASQIKMRAGRVSNDHALQVLAETDLNSVLAGVEASRPALVVIDSIQTMYSEEASGVAGGVAQVKTRSSKLCALPNKTILLLF